MIVRESALAMIRESVSECVLLRGHEGEHVRCGSGCGCGRHRYGRVLRPGQKKTAEMECIFRSTVKKQRTDYVQCQSHASNNEHDLRVFNSWDMSESTAYKVRRYAL